MKADPASAGVAGKPAPKRAGKAGGPNLRASLIGAAGSDRMPANSPPLTVVGKTPDITAAKTAVARGMTAAAAAFDKTAADSIGAETPTKATICSAISDPLGQF